MESQRLDISWATIAKIFLAIFAFYLIFVARDIIIWLFFGMVIAVLLDPAVRALRKIKIPNFLAVVIVYLAIFGALGGIIYATAPIFLVEVNQLIKNAPYYFDKINPVLKDFGFNIANNFSDLSSQLTANLKDSSGGIVKAVANFFGGLYSSLFIFTFAFFISLEHSGTERFLALLAPRRYEDQVVSIFARVQTKIAGWFGARILSCLFVGAASFLVFFALSIKYTFTLSLLSAVLNFIPYLGPTVTLIFVVVSAAVTNSWLVALYVLVALLVIQEIENKLLTPLLMKRFIDLPPVLVLASLLIGGAVFGFLGTIFAIPVFGIAYEFMREFLEKRKQVTED